MNPDHCQATTGAETFGTAGLSGVVQNSRGPGNEASPTRIDPAHERVSARDLIADEKPSTCEVVPDAPSAERLRLQADQLAARLSSRQRDLDQREAELNSKIARWESEVRVARLWLSERETDLERRNEELARLQQEAEEHPDLRRIKEADGRKQTSEPPAARNAEIDRREAELRHLAETLTARQKQCDEAEERLAKAQAETAQLQEQLLRQQRAFQDESAAAREKMLAEHQRAMAELAHKRQVVERRAEEVDKSRATLKQLRNELGHMHRETLEIRLATEEVWVRLSGAAPPAALTQSLGRIRAKLAEQQHQAEAETAHERQELESIRSELTKQQATLVEQKRQFDQWVADRQKESGRQASRLIAREQQLHRQEIEHGEQSRAWQAERMKYEQELRRLRAELAAREQTVAAS
jgi:hypothetical protein